MNLNEDIFAPNVETTDEIVSLEQIYMKMRFPSVANYIFSKVPVHGPTGAIFAIRGKSTKDGIELLRENVEVFPDMLQKSCEISKEAVDDIFSMFGLDGIKMIAAYLAGFAKEEENEKTLQFLEANCVQKPTITLSDPKNSEIVWKELSNYSSQFVLEANMKGKITFNAFLLLPYKYAASIAADFADLHNSDENNLNDAFVGSTGFLKFYVNPDPSSSTAYVGLLDTDNNGKSAATFSEYFNELRETIDPTTGNLKYFIFNKFALTKNPLHTNETPMMFKFDIQE